MVKIEPEFECTTENGKCYYKDRVCIDPDVDDSDDPWVCPFLKMVRKPDLERCDCGDVLFPIYDGTGKKIGSYCPSCSGE